MTNRAYRRYSDLAAVVILLFTGGMWFGMAVRFDDVGYGLISLAISACGLASLANAVIYYDEDAS